MKARLRKATRRENLRIIGAIGSTCAFPFSADTLYGQHVHREEPVTITPAGPYRSRIFAAPAFAVICRVADLIIPATDTPGALAAGVPRYIDEVVAANPEHKQRFLAGVEALDSAARKQFGKKFLELEEARQIAILGPLCEAVDQDRVKTAAQRFFRLMKSMTADGYYTSRLGLVGELGYKGNTVLAAFPECNHPEHRG
jgi:gluconate 2-dehydrogenase gamma chain